MKSKSKKQNSKKKLALLSIAINNRCNFQCRGCYVSKSYGFNSDEMSDDILKSKISEALNRLKDYSVIVGFAVKEPLLDKEILRIAFEEVAKFRDKNVIDYALITNGTYENVLNCLDILKKYKPIIDVSLNGGTADDNDLIRGEGSFEKAINGIKLLLREGFDVGIAYTIQSENLSFIKDFNKVFDKVKIKRVSYSIFRSPSGEKDLSDTDNLGDSINNLPKFSVSTISKKPNTINKIADEQIVFALRKAIETTPEGVEIMVESSKKKHLTMLAGKLNGVLTDEIIPQIIFDDKRIIAVSPENFGILHIRLMHNGLFCNSKNIFSGKAGGSLREVILIPRD